MVESDSSDRVDFRESQRDADSFRAISTAEYLRAHH